MAIMQDAPRPSQLDAPRWAAQFMRERVAFHRLLGIEARCPEPGRAIFEMPFRPEWLGDPERPALHGGVLAALADGCAGAAVLSALRPGDRCSTVDLRIDYLRPAEPKPLVAEAELLRLGERIAVSRVAVAHPGEPQRPLAVVQAVFAVQRLEPPAPSHRFASPRAEEEP